MRGGRLEGAFCKSVGGTAIISLAKALKDVILSNLIGSPPSNIIYKMRRAQKYFCAIAPQFPKKQKHHEKDNCIGFTGEFGRTGIRC